MILLFYEEDKTAINTFSDYASVAIENSLLLEQSIEKERLEKEFDVARDIQRKIFRQKILSLKTFLSHQFSYLLLKSAVIIMIF